MTSKEYANLAAMANAQGKVLHQEFDGGYTLIDPPAEPEPVAVVRYSKLAIIRALKGVNLWASVKAAIVDADAQDEWDAAAWLASDDPLFVSLKNQLAESYPNVYLEELLEQCKY